MVSGAGGSRIVKVWVVTSGPEQVCCVYDMLIVSPPDSAIASEIIVIGRLTTVCPA